MLGILLTLGILGAVLLAVIYVAFLRPYFIRQELDALYYKVNNRYDSIVKACVRDCPDEIFYAIQSEVIGYEREYERLSKFKYDSYGSERLADCLNLILNLKRVVAEREETNG